MISYIYRGGSREKLLPSFNTILIFNTSHFISKINEIPANFTTGGTPNPV